jgi:hypothetical protein
VDAAQRVPAAQVMAGNPSGLHCQQHRC